MGVLDLIPTNRAAVEAFGSTLMQHRLHPAASRLYWRMQRREVLLRTALPSGIKLLLAQWLHRDQLVLASTIFVDRSGRRFACLARTFEPGLYREAARSWSYGQVPGMRVALTQVLWPAPDPIAWHGRFADLAF
jgi:hypothetical protein